MKHNPTPHLNQFYQFNYCSIPLWIWFQPESIHIFHMKTTQAMVKSEVFGWNLQENWVMSGGEMPMLTVLRSSWSPIFSGRFFPPCLVAKSILWLAKPLWFPTYFSNIRKLNFTTNFPLIAIDVLIFPQKTVTSSVRGPAFVRVLGCVRGRSLLPHHPPSRVPAARP